MAEGATPAILLAEMTADDLPAVLAIEATSFAVPWPEAIFRQEILSPLARSRVARPLGPDGQDAVGYAVFWLFAGEGHLHHIAVRADWRRRGVASRLVEDMMRLAREAGTGEFFLELRPSNEAARRLYEKKGFALRGRRPCYYDDTGEDALVMGMQLAAARGSDTRPGETP
jgi:ribosomal-protein-alanine N-acetyltransferase